MARFGPDTGRLEVHTYREGVAAKVGHDLIIEVTKWAGSDDGGALELTADPRSLVVREGNRGAILAMLLDGTIDLAIMGQPPDEADVTAQRFAPHPTVIVAHPGHALRGRVAPAELAAEWFVTREDGSGTRSLSDAFFRRAGFAPRVVMETSSNEMIKQSVIAGMGLALISRHTVSLEAALGLLVPLAIEDASLMRSWFVVQRRTLPLLPVQARLRGFLVEQGHAVIDAIGHDHAALSPLGTTLARMKRG